MAKFCLLAVFVATASGLVFKKESDSEGPGFWPFDGSRFEVVKTDESKPIVQILRSDEGMAYYGSMFVGGQQQVSIYDTGSFDIVVASQCLQEEKDTKMFIKGQFPNGTQGEVGVSACCSIEKCPHAHYSTSKSGANFAANSDKEIDQITYGSGPVIVRTGTDHVRLSDESQGKTKGNMVASADIPVKVIVDHEVDLFNDTEMTAIVGVGPGHFSERDERWYNKMGVKRFMVCFQENARDNGYWTWQDRDRSNDANWMTVPVTGKLFWALKTSNFQIDNANLGCNPSCGGIIDTGTSLLTPPKAVIDAMAKKLESSEIEDCSDLSKFPDFKFKLGDHEFTLPPSSYIADAGMQQIEVFRQQLAFQPLPMTKRDLAIVKAQAEQDKPGKKGHKKGPEKGQAPTQPVHACVLLLSPGDETEQTQFGPMVIFGMSLFRKYAVQFDLSSDIEGKEGQRALRFAEAAHDCSGPVKGGEFRRKSVLQKVDLSKLRVSPLQQRFVNNRFSKRGYKMMQKAVFRI